MSSCVDQDYGLISPSDDDCLASAPLTMTKKRKAVVCEDIKTQTSAKAEWLINSLSELGKVAKGTNAEWEIQANDGEWLLYNDIIKEAYHSKEELFSKTEQWLDSQSNEINLEIESIDANTGIIKGSAEMAYNPPLLKFGLLTTGIVRYDLVISIKEGAYNYLFKNFIHESQVRKEMNPLNLGRVSNDTPCFKTKQLSMTKKQKAKVTTYLKEQIDNHINDLLESYDRFLD